MKSLHSCVDFDVPLPADLNRYGETTTAP